MGWGHVLLLSRHLGATMRRTPPPLHSPSSPPSPLPFLLLLLLLLGTAASVPPPTGGAAPFPQDLEPISVVGRDCEYSIHSLVAAETPPESGLDVAIVAA